jgi:transposase-like protein
MAKYRTFTPEFKAQVVLELLTGAKSAAELCREHHLKDSVVYRWKQEFLNDAAQIFQHDDSQRQAEARIAELERLVGRLTLELDIAKKVSTLLQQAQQRNERSSES